MYKKNQLEKNRLKKVASWYDPQNQRIENILINYRADVMIPQIKGPKVLEMGCSTGVMTKRLIKKFPGLTVIDGSEEYIKYTRKLTKAKDAEFIVALFEEFEAKEKFNDIIMANALEHVEDPVLILKRSKNWLKNDGKIYIMVPNAQSFHRRIGQKLGIIKNLTDLSESDRKLGHRRVYTEKSLKKDIKKAGLRVVHFQGIFLKPLSHAQIVGWDKKLLDAFFEMGKLLPDYCSTIYFICKKI